MVRVIENEDGPQAALVQVGQQFVVTGPIVFALPRLGRLPLEVHPHELEPRGGNQVQVLLMPGDEVNVHPNASRQHRCRDFSPSARQGHHGHQNKRLQLHHRSPFYPNPPISHLQKSKCVATGRIREWLVGTPRRGVPVRPKRTPRRGVPTLPRNRSRMRPSPPTTALVGASRGQRPATACPVIGQSGLPGLHNPMLALVPAEPRHILAVSSP